MTEGVLALLPDAGRRGDLGRRARERAVADFDWHVIAARARRLYASL
jgi:hypothetical protein